MDAQPNDITPGIARTVAWLQGAGFDTCDSGDGRTNVDAGMGCALPFANVTMIVAPERLAAEADRLLELVAERGVTVAAMTLDEGEPSIQATYDPATKMGLLSMLGIDDARLGL